jgi:tellurite resistance protein TehA-like permease
MRTALDDVVTWTIVVFIVGGTLVAMGGALIYKLARVARHSDPTAKPDRWMLVAFIGVALAAAGLALNYFFNRPDSHRQTESQPDDPE